MKDGMSLKTHDVLQFGDFEVDPVGRSVTRGEVKLALNRRAFDVLLFMAQHPGEVLSREHLLKSIWPDSYVDENSLSQSISALRRALEEKPGENSYIATLPGRGYQFLATVQVVPGKSGTEAIADGSMAERPLLIQEYTVSRQVVTQEHRESTSRRRRLRVGWPLAIVSVLVLSSVGYMVWRNRHEAGYQHVGAVLADLQNETGDPEFDHTLNKVLQIDLQQSPYFAVVSEGKAKRTLQMMRQDPDGPLTAGLAREVCQRLNDQVYVVPGIAKLGSRYSLTMQLNACSDGHTLGSGREEVSSKNEVLSAWSSLTNKMRRDAGETRRSLRDFDKALYDEPTSSLQALKAYSDAVPLGDRGKFQEAIALYQHAIDLDPNFAVAYADMSSMYFNLDDPVGDKAAISKAYALRDTANERERFYIELRYAQSVTGDLNALLQALHQWAGMYPDDNLPLSDLANFETWTGQYTAAAAYADRVLEIQHRQNIHNGISYEIAARAYHHANMPDKLRAVYAEALQWKVDTPGIHCVMLEFAAENGDAAEVQRQIASARNTPAEAHILQNAALAALAAGQVRRADALLAEARKVAERDKLQDSLADLDDDYVRMLVELGFTAKAKALLTSLPPADPSLDRAFAQAAVGDTSAALAEAARRKAAAPQDTLINVEYIPSVQAVVALHEGEPQEAISLLAPSAPFELRDPTVPYLRGQAYLAAHMPEQAMQEFAKLSDHPWLADPPAPLMALSHLGLARALAQQHQDAQAVEQYKKLFSLWSDADSGIPILRQARLEASQLSPDH
jgi:DNA-binding winged helix-turn-helix (wHTH) protein